MDKRFATGYGRTFGACANHDVVVEKIPLVLPQWCVPMPNVKALMTTRHGGMSKTCYGNGTGQGGLNLALHVGDDPACVMHNRALLRTLVPNEPIWLEQIHANNVLDAGNTRINDTLPQADAIWTSKHNTVCAIMTADCLPVLLADVNGCFIGAAHAGWRGLASGVLEKTIRAMRSAGAGTIQAWLGVAIGAARFEVGEEVRAALSVHRPHGATYFEALPQRSGKYLCDLYGLARLILKEQDVTMVSGGDRCTATEENTFYSFRRDGTTGRMAALIWRD